MAKDKKDPGKIVYFWWYGRDFLYIVAQFLRYAFMCGPENIRVRFYPDEEIEEDGEKRKGVYVIWDEVEKKRLYEGNYTHTCPPPEDCGD